MSGIVGLDLSIRGTGMCFLPDGWDGKPSGVVTGCVSAEREKGALGRPRVLAKLEVERYLKIAKGVIGFVKRHGAEHVAVEQYAYSQGHSSSVTKLAELGGAVKTQLLLSCGTPAVPVAVNSARSFLTGGLKRGKQKEQVERFFKKLGFVFDTKDEMDAFVIAAYWFCKTSDKASPFLPQQRLF